MDNYYKSEDFKKILTAYENSIASGDASLFLGAGDIADVAQYYHDKHDDEKALKAVDYALEIFPGSVAPLSFKSRYALLEEHDSQKANEIADEIADKDDPDYILLKAEIMIVDNKPYDADDYLEEAYNQMADDDYHDDMPLDVAMLYADYEETELADKWLQRSDETDEDDYKETKARILMASGMPAESEAILNKLIDNDPYSSNLWNMLSFVQLTNAEYNDAVTSSDFALAIDPEYDDALLNKGKALLGIGNFKEAAECFRKYIMLDPTATAGYILIATAYIEGGRYQESLQWLHRGLKVATKKGNIAWQEIAEILYNMANIENILGHFDKVHEFLKETEDVLENSLKDNLEELHRRLADIYCAQGHTSLEEGDEVKSKEWFDKAIAYSDNDPMTLIKIAISNYENGFIDRAYKILHDIVYIKGNTNEIGLRYLSECCRRLGRKNEQQWADEALNLILPPGKN